LGDVSERGRRWAQGVLGRSLICRGQNNPLAGVNSVSVGGEEGRSRYRGRLECGKKKVDLKTIMVLQIPMPLPLGRGPVDATSL